MSVSRSEHSMSAPSSPTRTASPIPPSPPSPPLVLLPPPPPAHSDETSNKRLLPSHVGNLENFLRSSTSQKKWALVVILPRATSFSLTTSPPAARGAPITPRPAWGPSARHQPTSLFASSDIVDNITLWRRTVGSAEAERYQAFFPIDGHPHLALLDPRSGERLAVWGNIDGKNMAAPTKLDVAFWSQVLRDLENFLKVHSLEDGALGPAHYREKPWDVRTRRVLEQPADSNATSTSVMDDEDAAIAAAIAASLAESGAARTNQDQTSSIGDPSQEEEEDHETFYSSDSMTQDEYDSSNNGSQDDGDSINRGLSETGNNNEGEEMDITGRGGSMLGTRSQPIAIFPQRRDPPSSVESLSLSHIERMESRLRSSMDPDLIAARLLREEQDAELAKSLQEDRLRAQEEREAAAKRELRREQQLLAKARLGEEPLDGSANVVVIALRLSKGVRIARRFYSFDRLERVADFAIAETGCAKILDKTPRQVLRIPRGTVEAERWDVKIGDLKLGNRVMFVVDMECE